MRIVKILLTTIAIMGVIGLLIFLAAREVLLIISISRVKQALKSVREVDVNQSYLTDCMNRGASRDSEGRMHSTQLRFIDEENYVLEVVCNNMEHNPIKFGEGKLATMVVSQPGQSGIRWGQDAGLNFICFNRVASISVVDSITQTSLKASSLAEARGPASICASYSYQCCDLNTQVGEGVLLSEALDCPKSCYQSCLERPLILSFNTKPYYDRLTRTLEISNNQAVTFSYMVTPNQDASFQYFEETDDPIENFIMAIDAFFSRQADSEQVKVYLDYGDGDQEKFTGQRGQVQHIYQCPRFECEYQPKLKVIKENGVESLDNAQNTIKIKVDSS